MTKTRGYKADRRRKRQVRFNRLCLERLERRNLLAGDVAASTAIAVEPLDVNGDGVVSPSDALEIINQINAPMAEGEAPVLSFDVNGDQAVTPLDVLLVIDRLNTDAAAAMQTPQTVFAPQSTPGPSGTIPTSSEPLNETQDVIDAALEDDYSTDITLPGTCSPDLDVSIAVSVTPDTDGSVEAVIADELEWHPDADILIEIGNPPVTETSSSSDSPTGETPVLSEESACDDSASQEEPVSLEEESESQDETEAPTNLEPSGDESVPVSESDEPSTTIDVSLETSDESYESTIDVSTPPDVSEDVTVTVDVDMTPSPGPCQEETVIDTSIPAPESPVPSIEDVLPGVESSETSPTENVSSDDGSSSSSESIESISEQDSDDDVSEDSSDDSSIDVTVSEPTSGDLPFSLDTLEIPCDLPLGLHLELAELITPEVMQLAVNWFVHQDEEWQQSAIEELNEWREYVGTACSDGRVSWTEVRDLPYEDVVGLLSQAELPSSIADELTRIREVAEYLASPRVQQILTWLGSWQVA